MPLDRRERSGELTEAFLCAQEGHQARIWTALPGIVQSFDAGKKTCVVQPAIQAQVQDAAGNVSWVTLPLLLDCPVQFPGGGGVTLTFPLALGDECLVVFSSRCIDAWWQSGGIQAQAELRMHDLSDGFCIPGISSLPAVPANISASRAELRAVDGQQRVWLDPTGNTVGLINGNTYISMTSTQIFMFGDVYINGELYDNHKHYDTTDNYQITGKKYPA